MGIDAVWIARKLIEYMILPPTPLFLLIALGVWRRKRARSWNILWIAAAVALGLLSLPVVGYVIQRPLESDSKPLDPSAILNLPRIGSVIVVLGGGTTLGAIEFPERETLSPASLLRSRYGAQLAAKTGLPLAVSSGKAFGAQISEAALMKRFIEAELKQPVVLSEEQSLDTRQSALYIAQELTRLKIRSVVLVTDALHMRRAKGAFERAGLAVVAAPMNFHATRQFDSTDFLPSIYGMSVSQAAFHELIGEAWYRLNDAFAAKT